ncbi:MAG: bifunctional acetate--CoA ligase family protein/GNAT family N-acetyltransferase [Verrucomicrobia bacterium]|nr:bifunctional acetate--CoA ligase family protein/GNAT family N-acetyltransferase [Verrucomicrobiota bacterium]
MKSQSITNLAPEHAHDILRHARRHPLESIFAPRTVAVIGATDKEGSVGRAVLKNLSAFAGTVFPINPRRTSVLGIQAFPNISEVPQKVDLAVIVTPAPTVSGIVRECVEAGVRGAIIISAGFKECGASGAELEQNILAEARRGRLRVIGPNCLGVMSPHAQFNPTFAATMARPGNVAFISQSGALCTAILDWSLRENVGFSAFVSVGSMLDVGWGDLIYYLGDDPYTRSIVIYMESVGDARSFLSAAREVALTKPIIVIKVGRTEAAAKAAASHTGSLTGSDEVLEAAFRRVGVLRVNTIEELFDMSEVLAKQPRPRGPRLAIVTNAGGPGALATDMLVNSGGQLAEFSETTRAALDQLLPPHWSHNNPIDILGDAGPERYAKAVELAARDANSDGVLAILTPQAMTEAVATAEHLKPFAKLDGKPLLACWMGGPAVEGGEAILNSSSIPTFKYPDRAARAFDLMWRYTQNLRSLYETPALNGTKSEPKSGSKPTELMAKARKAGRTLLTEFESKQILVAYDIPTVATRVALTEEEAVAQASDLGYPVVVKLFSESLTHKTEVGGVHLNIRNAAGVRRAWRAIESSVRQKAGAHHFLGVTVQPMISLEGYELILGSSIDAQFGPVLLFGAGGQLVEVFKDRALGLPPLNATLARRLMEQTRIYTALRGVRGRSPVDLAALEQLLVRFSQLVAEQRWIKEIDINPLLVSSDRILALDARIVLHEPTMREDQLPRSAIRPYPSQYVTGCKLRDGTSVTIRPIRPEDEPLMVTFHQTLSERSVYYRYFTPLRLEQRTAHERLARICFIDYDREMALVVERDDEKSGQREIVGVGRLSKLHGANDAEFALLVSDQWQRLGLGTRLLKTLVQIGRDEKLDRITATILPDNREMQHVCRRVGFQIRHEVGDAECRAEILL